MLLKTYFDISSTFKLRTSSMVFELSSGAFSPKKQGHLHRWLKTSDIKLLQIYLDIFSALELHKQVYIFNGSRA